MYLASISPGCLAQLPRTFHVSGLSGLVSLFQLILSGRYRRLYGVLAGVIRLSRTT